MNLAIISGKGWYIHPGAVKTLLLRMAATNNSDTLLLDFDTIKRESNLFPAIISHNNLSVGLEKFCYILFNKWIKDTRIVNDSIDANAILEIAREIPSDKIVVIDARNYDIELIQSALEVARYAWYPLDQWHPTLALVADDMYLLRLLPKLANTFYIQPQILSDQESKLIVKKIMRNAFIYRWFGLKGGRFDRLVSNLLDLIDKYSRKIIFSRE